VPANRSLKAARTGAGLSQGQLADRINETTGRGTMDANTISRLERGVIRWPGRTIREALSDTLGVPVDALGFVRPGSDVPAMALPDGSLVDGDFVDSMRGEIAHLAALDGMHGGAEVAPLALRSFRRAQRVLADGRYTPAVERDLEAVTAEMGELAGWLLFDAERQAESRTVNAEALTLARIAGDASMEWFVLTNQALASIHTGRYREALRISRAMTCGTDLPGRVRALFDVRRARALGGLGDEAGALDALERAESAFADGVGPRDPSWSWWFDERELAGHRGMTLASLGRVDTALPLLAEAVERSEGREQFRWALYIHRANLLRTLLAAGDRGEAERVALAITPMVGEIASARTEKLLLDVAAQPPRDSALSSTLQDVLVYIGQQLATDCRRSVR
jgi:transcriptional regulator with XRE-family HTH domain